MHVEVTGSRGAIDTTSTFEVQAKARAVQLDTLSTKT